MTTAVDYGRHLATLAAPLSDSQVEAAARILAFDEDVAA